MMKHSIRWAWLSLACALFACARVATPTTDAGVSASPPSDAGHRVGGVAPSGNGYSFNSSGLESPKALGPATPTATAANMFLSGYCDGGSLACWSLITQDQIAAAFTPTFVLASGGGTFEIGNPSGCAPTYNATPATNAGTVTGCTIADNQGNGPTSVSHANAINVDTPAGPHVYSLSTPGTVTATVTETQISPNVTKSATATGCTFDYRWFFTPTGDTHSGGNTITASGTNATLGGGSATASMTGALAATFTNLSFAVAPVNQYVYAAFPHTATAHTFKDQNGFVFVLNVVVTSYSFTNSQGVVGVLMDIYRTDNLLNSNYTVTVTSDARDWRRQPVSWRELPAANDERAFESEAA